MKRASHLGLYSEIMDPSTGDFLGNFSKAFSHIGVIHTAGNLRQALERDGSLAELLVSESNREFLTRAIGRGYNTF